MNFPVWSVQFGSPLLIAVIAIVHVFVSHFAVGGGLFLVLTEKKSYKTNNETLLIWLKKHTKFFVLLTVVFGAVTGVGIWFTIGLIQPSATSALIHAFVWGWAIEWVFFFIEIASALLYLYGWEKIDKSTHIFIGWVYFWSAFFSMVVINGMITFMLTPGEWISTHNFWDGFFNPTYFPSLFIRFSFSIALAGIYALVTAAFFKGEKVAIVKWSSLWVVAGFVLLPVIAYWYKGNVPFEYWERAETMMPTAKFYLELITIFSALTFISTVLAYVFRNKIKFMHVFPVIIFAFLTMWSFEFIREAVRKPFVIGEYMYGNSIVYEAAGIESEFTIENIKSKGLLNTAKWVKNRQINERNNSEAGEEIFRIQCASCHTVNSYRSIGEVIIKRGWSKNNLKEMIGTMDGIMAGVMPPFAGTHEELEVLTDYIYENNSYSVDKNISYSSSQIFDNYCGRCHRVDSDDVLFSVAEDLEEEEIKDYIFNLSEYNELMPALEFDEGQADSISKFIQSVSVKPEEL